MAAMRSGGRVGSDPVDDPFSRADREAFKAGDSQAIRLLYREFAGPVMAVAASIVRNPADAADVTQQAFIKAWQSAHRIDVTRRIEPWLFTIARNTAIDMLRARDRHPRISIDLVAEPADSSVESIDDAWQRWQVRQALDRLPIDEREICRLSYLLGFSNQEIAERLRLPVGTVKSRARRARSRLAKLLAHLANDDRPVTTRGDGR